MLTFLSQQATNLVQLKPQVLTCLSWALVLMPVPFSKFLLCFLIDPACVPSSLRLGHDPPCCFSLRFSGMPFRVRLRHVQFVGTQDFLRKSLQGTFLSFSFDVSLILLGSRGSPSARTLGHQMPYSAPYFL